MDSAARLSDVAGPVDVSTCAVAVSDELSRQSLNPLKPLIRCIRLLLNEVARDGRSQRPDQPNTEQHQQYGHALPKGSGRISVAVSNGGHRLDGPPQALAEIVNVGAFGTALGEGDQSRTRKNNRRCGENHKVEAVVREDRLTPTQRLAHDHRNTGQGSQPGTAAPAWPGVDTFADVLAKYETHPEAKSLGPDGRPCDRSTIGLLQRRPVTVGTITLIGKESNRLEEREAGELTWENADQWLTTYEDHDEWYRFVLPKLRSMDQQELATAAGMSYRIARCIGRKVLSSSIYSANASRRLGSRLLRL